MISIIVLAKYQTTNGLHINYINGAFGAAATYLLMKNYHLKQKKGIGMNRKGIEVSDNLWYIYDIETNNCDECGKVATCAVWHNEALKQFTTLCAECDKPHLAKK